jgi:hypothetical protein
MDPTAADMVNGPYKMPHYLASHNRTHCVGLSCIQRISDLAQEPQFYTLVTLLQAAEKYLNTLPTTFDAHHTWLFAALKFPAQKLFAAFGLDVQ